MLIPSSTHVWDPDSGYSNLAMSQLIRNVLSRVSHVLNMSRFVHGSQPKFVFSLIPVCSFVIFLKDNIK